MTTEAGQRLLRELRAGKPSENWLSIASWVEAALPDIEDEAALQASPPTGVSDGVALDVALVTRAWDSLTVIEIEGVDGDVRRSRDYSAFTAVAFAAKYERLAREQADSGDGA